MPPKEPRRPPLSVQRAVTEGATIRTTPSGGVPGGATIRTTPSGGVPDATWEGEDQKSGVHVAEGETQLASIARVAREIRGTGDTTLDTLVKHDKSIVDLTAHVTTLAGRVSTVEDITTAIKGETADIKVETTEQSRMIVAQGTAQGIQSAKLDTMLQILDPSAPQRVREIVASELRVTEHMEQREVQKTILVEKSKFNIELVKQAGIIVAAIIAGGGLTLMARGC